MKPHKIKNVKSYRHPKTGKWYAYFRPTGEPLSPPHDFGTADFYAAVQDAERRYKRRTADRASNRGTLGAMMSAYRASEDYSALKGRTKRDYTQKLEWLIRIGDVPVRRIDRVFVYKLRDEFTKRRTWHFANSAIAVLSVVFRFGVQHGFAPENPCIGVRKVPRPKGLPRANRAWTEAEKQIVLGHCPPHLLIPVAIARWTGLREGDVLDLPRNAFDGREITTVTSKRDVSVVAFCPDALCEILSNAPKHDSVRLCANSRGLPWTKDGFRASFFKLVRQLEKDGKIGPGLTFHGLRTSYAEEAKSKGSTVEDIADALGQRSARSAQHYLREADRRIGARRVGHAINRTDGDQ